MDQGEQILKPYLYDHQKRAIQQQQQYPKCLINMWCGTGKTRTFTIDLFINNKKTNVIVFPSLGLINQYCNDYVLSSEVPFKSEFEKYECLSFCSDNDGKLTSKGKIIFTTDEDKLKTFVKKTDKKLVLVTYHSFEKFIDICIDNRISIDNLIFDEAHHIVGDKIQSIVFNNQELENIVEQTRYYTATPVNKNGITMYDRDDPENSDCGPLAYEYLYYQAIEDKVCKSFETQISLYTQKPEYKNKYQPVFESIIRACLSGKYDYWNILAYHSLVNESEDMSDTISFVKEFASEENQTLVKELFTKIQNEEFPHTKALYSVDNVILKGLHSETLEKQQIINGFDQKVPGRIYILSSCGMLNEGIDTKWANMGVPINPTKSIVKESQRIGRLVRVPDEGMPPAIILIPCEVDIAKYSSLDTPEKKDQMIREELSECGNFNTALNVISAFKYQYDPDLFEMCLRYPNMYAPKEVKDNLEKQGLIVEESQGNLLDNIKYVCEKERIELDIDGDGIGNKELLKLVAEKCDKTIEIHTQNHDEPIKYVNEESMDEIPLRLFYCEDDKTYSPIVKKDKKQTIKRKSTEPPKKRPKLFDVHMHPDLEVIWKIKESSIDFDKAFSQGVLEVDINWNEKKWMEKYTIVKGLDSMPSQSFITENGVKIGGWCAEQRTTKKKNKLSKERIGLLEEIPGWFWDLDKLWMEKYTIVKGLDSMPSQSFITENGVKIGTWCSTQRTDKRKNKLTQEKIDLLEAIPGWFWEKDLDELWMEKYTIVKGLNYTPQSSFITEGGLKIGIWCEHQRAQKRNNKLTQEKIDLLEAIPGWYWDSDKQWMEKYTIVKCLKTIPPQSFITENGIRIGGWCSKQRADKHKNNLSQEKIDLLEAIPVWFWEKDFDEVWMEKYDILKGLETTPGAKFITENGVKIGSWCHTQITDKRNNKLSKERIGLLEEIPGWVWERNIFQTLNFPSHAVECRSEIGEPTISSL